MVSPFTDMTSFFLCCFVSLVKFSYWSKFHINIITGSGAMTIFFYKGLTRNPEIRNTLLCVLPNIWRLGQVGDTKFCTNIFNKLLLNAAKCKGYSCYRFLLRENQQGEGGNYHQPRLELKTLKSQNKCTFGPKKPTKALPQTPSCKNDHFANTFSFYKSQSSSRKQTFVKVLGWIPGCKR